MSSLWDTLSTLREYIRGAESNALVGDVADDALAELQRLGLATGVVLISWLKDGGADLNVQCRLDQEAEIRSVVRRVADGHEFKLSSPKRTDRLSTYGTIDVNYGPLRLIMAPDGTVCRTVQVGTRTIEVPVYEVRCGDVVVGGEEGAS